ncbi:protein of unassigned function [Methylobacterium oryzae CBMB20]|uniref:Protein of unassigned function n=1 Tax=Methylobacterium oryzae CBMB20 TaxID=693986 RepID=A0A089NZR8_9HYPH|nr:protein of unassigned function [Methylobacterium oryzae CBMB20]
MSERVRPVRRAEGKAGSFALPHRRQARKESSFAKALACPRRRWRIRIDGRD